MPKQNRGGEQSMVPEATPMSYYGLPILKSPTWKWPIPAYLFTGGLAAGAGLVAGGARLSGDRRLAVRSSWISMAAVGISGGLLIQDLGRPDRFYNMLRVFKPTSPMSVGTWIFSLFAALTGTALAAEIGHSAGMLPPGVASAAAAAQIGAAVVAPALATYTGVLVADTAVPAWHEARYHLPYLFAGSAAAAGAAAVTVVSAFVDRTVPASARRLVIVGAVAELGVDVAMHRHLSTITTGDPDHPTLAAAYRSGLSRRLSVAAKLSTVAGAGILASVGRRRWALGAVGGIAVMAGSAAERFAIFEAGKVAAADPVYTVGPQRARSGLSP
jgi:formate-dependent nitrite reductase membrane component NrfD